MGCSGANYYLLMNDMATIIPTFETNGNFPYNGK